MYKSEDESFATLSSWDLKYNTYSPQGAQKILLAKDYSCTAECLRKKTEKVRYEVLTVAIVQMCLPS